MLVLSRKSGERILVAGDIVITVVEVANGRVRLGIDAPKDVDIWREELAPFGKEAPVPRATPALCPLPR